MILSPEHCLIRDTRRDFAREHLTRSKKPGRFGLTEPRTGLHAGAIASH